MSLDQAMEPAIQALLLFLKRPEREDITEPVSNTVRGYLISAKGVFKNFSETPREHLMKGFRERAPDPDSERAEQIVQLIRNSN